MLFLKMIGYGAHQGFRTSLNRRIWNRFPATATNINLPLRRQRKGKKRLTDCPDAQVYFPDGHTQATLLRPV